MNAAPTATRPPSAIEAATAAVFVVENPSLLAEAATGGWSGPPLVCSSGWPNVAVLTLLRQLRASGCSLHLHADWDEAGCGVVRLLAERTGGVPWEMPEGLKPPAVSRYKEDQRAALLGRITSAGN